MYPIGDMCLSAWEIAADIWAETKKSGKTIDDTDILIAAFCMANGFVLVTDNIKHFERIDGLRFENWLRGN